MTATATLDLHLLRPLDDSPLELADPRDDLRGRRVIGDDGRGLGRVSGVLIDQEEGRAQLLRVRSGGFLGLGGHAAFLPVSAIVRVTRDVITVAGHSSGRVTARAYDPRLIARERPDEEFDPVDRPAYSPYWTTDYPYRVPRGR